MCLTAYHCSQIQTRHLLFRAGECQVSTDIQTSQEVLCNKMKRLEECLADIQCLIYSQGQVQLEEPYSNIHIQTTTKQNNLLKPKRDQ